MTVKLIIENGKLNDFFYKMKDLPFEEKDIQLFSSAGYGAGLTQKELNVFFLILGFYKGRKDAEVKLNQKAEQLTA